MPRKKYSELTLEEKLSRITKAGLSDEKLDSIESKAKEISDLTIDEKIDKILGIIENPNRKVTDMLCFIMYDIESDKVRNQIVKYLLKKGCLRVQKSIFLADLTSETYDIVRSELTAVQSYYDNDDSILIVPISTDYLKSMKIIGKKIDVDIILKAEFNLQMQQNSD
ncbi:MAG: CRISPR-associated endonuclease Cas2 [bacterium]